MSAENKALARRWFEEVWNRGRTEAIAEMFAADAIAHNLNEPGKDLQGPEGFRRYFETIHGAFPDLKVTVLDMIAENDLVVVRWSAKATHRGDHLGFPATNKPVTVVGTNVLRVANGKLVEGWDSWDRLSLMRQLGMAQGVQSPGS